MILVEGKHYLRREERPTPLPHPTKRFVDCLLCQRLDDSTAVGDKRKIINSGNGYRLDRLMAHYKSAHKNDLNEDGSRTLLDLGFSRVVAVENEPSIAYAAGLDHIHTTPISRPTTTQALAFGPAIATHSATVEWGHDLDGHQFWRIFRQQVDAIIKANA